MPPPLSPLPPSRIPLEMGWWEEGGDASCRCALLPRQAPFTPPEWSLDTHNACGAQVVPSLPRQTLALPWSLPLEPLAIRKGRKGQGRPPQGEGSAQDRKAGFGKRSMSETKLTKQYSVKKILKGGGILLLKMWECVCTYSNRVCLGTRPLGHLCPRLPCRICRWQRGHWGAPQLPCLALLETNTDQMGLLLGGSHH